MRFVNSLTAFIFAVLFHSYSFSQSLEQFEKLEVEMQSEIARSTTNVSPEDFPELVKVIAYRRNMTDDDLNNTNYPSEYQVKQMLKLARAYRDWQNDIASIQEKYSNMDKSKYYKEVMVRNYEITKNRGNYIYKAISDNASTNISFGEINKKIAEQLSILSAQQRDYEKFKTNHFSSLSQKSNVYVELHACVSAIAKADNDNLQLRGYPGKVFLKFNNNVDCRKYKEIEFTTSTINNFVGVNEVASLTVEESKNYKYDFEVTCSFGSILGGMLITPNQQAPKCLVDLQRFLTHYSNIAAQLNERNIKESNINAQIQKNDAIRSQRNSARSDPVAQVLNYASGVSEDASGNSFFYPVNTQDGQCIYKLAMDTNSPMGLMSSEIMTGLIGLSNFASAMTGQKDPSAVLTDGIDLNKGDLKNINFYKLQGAQRNKFTGTTAYLRYQSRVDGLPDLFECDSNSCNIDRLKRGWALVASKCKGTKKAF